MMAARKAIPDKNKALPARPMPAARIIKQLGGVAKVVQITGRAPNTVYKWMKPTTSGGTGGRVPASAQDAIVSYAEQWDLPITYRTFSPRKGEAFQ